MSAGVPFELFKTEFGSGADFGWLPAQGLSLVRPRSRLLPFGWLPRKRGLALRPGLGDRSRTLVSGLVAGSFQVALWHLLCHLCGDRAEHWHLHH